MYSQFKGQTVCSAHLTITMPIFNLLVIEYYFSPCIQLNLQTNTEDSVMKYW